MSDAVACGRSDLYARVTEQILADLAQGVRPWIRPWTAGRATGGIGRPLRHTLEPYGGINVLLLWSEAARRGFGGRVWMTYRQAAALGGQVRRGEHGATVVYAHRGARSQAEDEADGARRPIRFLKAYAVFNLDQIDGLEAPGPAEPDILTEEQRVARAEAFFAATGAAVRHGGDQACYLRDEDLIRLPPFGRFADAQAYYATLAHECMHWTGHPRRLDRDLGRRRFGDEGYAREELVAELGAAFLCADLGLELTPRDDHAAYIDGWLDVLSRDSRWIFSAAAHAQRATDYLHGLQQGAAVPGA